MSDEVTGDDEALLRTVWDEARDLVKRLEGSSVHRFVVAAGNCKIEIERGAPAPIAMPAEAHRHRSSPVRSPRAPGPAWEPRPRLARPRGCSRWAPRPRGR